MLITLRAYRVEKACKQTLLPLGWDTIKATRFSYRRLLQEHIQQKLTFPRLCLFDVHSIMCVPLSICLIYLYWFRSGCVRRNCQ